MTEELSGRTYSTGVLTEFAAPSASSSVTFKGRTKGWPRVATRVAFGHYGLMGARAGWISNRQIEASRVALTREMSGAARCGSGCSPTTDHQKPAETAWGREGQSRGWVAV